LEIALSWADPTQRTPGYLWKGNTAPMPPDADVGDTKRFEKQQRKLEGLCGMRVKLKEEEDAEDKIGKMTKYFQIIIIVIINIVLIF